jgi:hypothetical protein
MPVKSGGIKDTQAFLGVFFYPSSSSPPLLSPLIPLEAETTTASSASLLLHALKLVRDLLVRLEELGCAPVQADGFTFAEVAFAVGFVDAF